MNNNFLKKEQLEEDVRLFISGFPRAHNLSGQTNLIETGIIDSLNFIQIIIFFEKRFKIKLNPLKFRMDNLETIEAIVKFILENK